MTAINSAGSFRNGLIEFEKHYSKSGKMRKLIGRWTTTSLSFASLPSGLCVRLRATIPKSSIMGSGARM